MRNWAPSLAKLWVAYLIILLVGVQMVFSGVLPGNDDAMRLLQVRDWLSGGSWYDVSQQRLLTPEGGAMHWSRIPDIGIGALYFLARLFVQPEAAEVFAAIAWPVLLSFALAGAGLFTLGKLGVGRWFSLLAMLLVTQTFTFSQFAPGRVDHHGLQVVLMLVAMGALMGTRLRAGFIAGLALTVMLSLAIEALPIVAGCLIAAGLFWVLAPAERGRHLAAFGGGLLLGSALAFVLDAPGPSFSVRAVCDAFGNGHLVALMLGGAGFILLGRSKKLAEHATLWRFAAVCGVGAIAALSAMGISPECLASPYASLPDDVSARWLASVAEAKPVLAQELHMIWQYVPVLVFALLAGIWLVVKSEGEARRRWTFVLGLLTVSILATLWQTRGLTFSHILAMLVAGGIYERFFDKWRSRGGPGPLLVFSGVAIALAPMTWTLVSAQLAPDAPKTVEKAALGDDASCHSRDTLRTVLAGPPKRILSTIDAGAPIMYYTDNQVYSAPYHRNPEGIALPIHVFSGPFNEAEARVRAVDAQYLYFCKGGKSEEQLYTDWQPDGLAARLNAGQVPSWLKLEQEGVGGATLYRVINTQ